MRAKIKMKKNYLKIVTLVMMLICIALVAAVLSGCGNEENKKPKPTEAPEPTNVPDVLVVPDSYDMEAWTQKVWDGSIVYWEPVAFVTDINGEMPELTLMYKPSQILEVRAAVGFERVEEGRDYNYDWDTNTFSLGGTITLVEGRDYTVSETGKITLKYYKQKLVTTTWESLHPKYKEGQAHDWLEMSSDRSRYFNLYNNLGASRIYVTYVHQDEWGDSFKPTSQIDHLKRTKSKLENKEDLNFVIYGDSIATGADGTGYDETVIDVGTCKEVKIKNDAAPKTPSWAEMTTQKLKAYYGYEGINKINRAAGSSESSWGVKQVDALVGVTNPDVVVIAFGMNENGRSKEEHKANILKIMDSIHETNPDCEFILMSSMEINPEVGKTNLPAFEEAYYEIQKERTDLNVAVCPVNSVFWAVTNRGKLFTDISSSNFNHPNDFLIRLYAQTLIATLGM